MPEKDKKKPLVEFSQKIAKTEKEQDKAKSIKETGDNQKKEGS